MKKEVIQVKRERVLYKMRKNQEIHLIHKTLIKRERKMSPIKNNKSCIKKEFKKIRCPRTSKYMEYKSNKRVKTHLNLSETKYLLN